MSVDFYSHLKDLDNRQIQVAVVSAFDFFIDKDLAWEIIVKVSGSIWMGFSLSELPIN